MIIWTTLELLSTLSNLQNYTFIALLGHSVKLRGSRKVWTSIIRNQTWSEYNTTNTILYQTTDIYIPISSHCKRLVHLLQPLIISFFSLLLYIEHKWINCLTVGSHRCCVWPQALNELFLVLSPITWPQPNSSSPKEPIQMHKTCMFLLLHMPFPSSLSSSYSFISFSPRPSQSVNRYGYTGLMHITSRNSRLDVAKVLLENGADPSILSSAPLISPTPSSHLSSPLLPSSILASKKSDVTIDHHHIFATGLVVSRFMRAWWQVTKLI